VNSFTSSIRGEINGIEAYTASLKSAAIVSSSTQIQNYNLFATTGSNSFNGNQTITGSLIVSAVAVVNGAITIPTGSVLSLTSGSSIFVDSSGGITGSLTGSVFGIGNVAAFSSSVDSRLNTLETANIVKASGIVNAGTFVTLDNIKATVTTTSNRGLSLATVAGTVSGYISGQYQLISGSPNGGASTTNLSTTETASMFSWNFAAQGDTSTYILRDDTNNKVYRIILIIGGSYNNNFISIERLH
jgi:hypothetical protein